MKTSKGLKKKKLTDGKILGKRNCGGFSKRTFSTNSVLWNEIEEKLTIKKNVTFEYSRTKIFEKKLSK